MAEGQSWFLWLSVSKCSPYVCPATSLMFSLVAAAALSPLYDTKTRITRIG